MALTTQQQEGRQKQHPSSLQPRQSEAEKIVRSVYYSSSYDPVDAGALSRTLRSPVSSSSQPPSPFNDERPFPPPSSPSSPPARPPPPRPNTAISATCDTPQSTPAPQPRQRRWWNDREGTRERGRRWITSLACQAAAAADSSHYSLLQYRRKKGCDAHPAHSKEERACLSSRGRTRTTPPMSSECN